MRRTENVVRVLAVLIVLSGVASFAQAKPPIALYPLDVLVRGVSNAQLTELQVEARRLLGREAVQPDALALDAALELLKRQDCDTDDGCLKQFALHARTLYGLYVGVEADAKQKQFTAKGRVVRDDGTLVVPTKSVTVERKRGDSVEATVRVAVEQLIAALALSSLPPTRDVGPVAKDPVLKDPPPPLPPLVPEDTGAGQRAAGKALLIGGLSVAALGGVLAGVGCGIGCGVQPTTPGNSVPEADLGKATTGRALLTAGFVGAGVGAVAAAVGAVVWGTAAPAPVNQVTFIPTAGGGVMQFGGSF